MYLAGIAFEEVVREKPKLFEDRVDARNSLEYLFVVIRLEWLVDIEVDVSSVGVQSLRILIDELLECLEQYILGFLLFLQQIYDHDPPELRLDVIEMLE